MKGVLRQKTTMHYTKAVVPYTSNGFGAFAMSDGHRLLILTSDLDFQFAFQRLDSKY